MKKSLLTIAMLIGLSIGSSAQEGGGLFGMGPQRQSDYDYSSSYNSRDGLFLPSSHGLDEDSTGTPVGSGVLLLIGFGAAYALKQRKSK